MKSEKILFLDIDGTILLPDHSIQPSTLDAINQAKQQGIKVFIATGRPLHEISELKNKLNIDSCIGYNGAYATYQGKEIYNRPMDPTLVDYFIRTASEFNEEMVLYRKDANLFTNLEKPYVKHFANYFDLSQNEAYQESDRDKILGGSIMNVSDDHLKHYQKDTHFLSEVNVDGLRDSYDIIQKTTNKGEAIKYILAQFNLEPEQAIAFGDGLNDREMLSTVGKSFAMGNANPDLFQFAKYKTTSVEDNGIYNGLKQLGLVN